MTPAPPRWAITLFLIAFLVLFGGSAGLVGFMLGQPATAQAAATVLGSEDAGLVDAGPPVVPCAVVDAGACEECPKLPSHHCGFQPLLEDEDYCVPNMCIPFMTEHGMHCMVNPRLRTNLFELDKVRGK